MWAVCRDNGCLWIPLMKHLKMHKPAVRNSHRSISWSVHKHVPKEILRIVDITCACAKHMVFTRQAVNTTLVSVCACANVCASAGHMDQDGRLYLSQSRVKKGIYSVYEVFPSWHATSVSCTCTPNGLCGVF